MKITVLSLIVFIFSFSAFSQSTTVDPNQGVSVPQFTTIFINGLTNQPKGTIVFDKDLNVMKYWDGTAWVNLTAGGSGVGWAANGNHINNTNIGNVGIGVASPTAKVAIVGTDTNGSLAVSGSSHTSHFNYPTGGLENTYIRGGKAASHVLINDSQGLGNVGIGVSLPTSKLEVNGNGSFSYAPISYNNLFNEYTNGGLVVNNSSGYSGFMRMDASNVQGFSVNTLTYKSSPGKLVLNPFGGNVGVGTNFNPEYKLHLYSTGEQLVKVDGTNSLVVFHDRSTNAQYGFLRAWTSSPFNPAGYYGFEIGTPPATGGDPAKRLLFSTNYSIRMAIMENGNIGIGVNDPGSYKLAVNGSIRANEVVVETGWADYVFEKKFRLKPLSEVENFIKENNHLPDIPSAAEIQKNGAKLAELTTKMMQKIEELTLYSIAQDKRIEKLQADLTQLKAMNR